MRYFRESLVFILLFFCLFLFIAAPRNYLELKSSLSSLFAFLLWKPTSSESAGSFSEVEEKSTSEELHYLRLLTLKQNAEILHLKEELLQVKGFHNAYPQQDHSFIAAEVLHADLSNTHRSLYINRGKEHSLRKGLPVFWKSALVGEVVEVGKWKSRVRLIHDPSSQIRVALFSPKTLETSESLEPLEEEATLLVDQGILKGNGRSISLEWLAKDIPLKGNERVMTSLLSPYGKGWLIGKIQSLNSTENPLFYTLEVEPFAPLDDLQVVTVLHVESPSLQIFEHLSSPDLKASELRQRYLEECFLSDLEEVEPALRLSALQMSTLGEWFESEGERTRALQCYEKCLERHELAQSQENRLSRSLRQKVKEKVQALRESS